MRARARGDVLRRPLEGAPVKPMARRAEYLMGNGKEELIEQEFRQ